MAIGAIDIGGTKTITAIFNDKGEIVTIRQFPSESYNWEAHFALTTLMFKECENEYFQKTQDSVKILGVGINVPGMADNKNGMLIYAPHQNWKDLPVRDYFRKALKIENIQVENDVNSCAIGEMVYGGGGCDFLWLTISTGNGGAIVANSKLVRGSTNCAGEIGHIKVEFENPRSCACGQYGCLESQSSGTAIKQIFEESILNNDEFRKQVEKFERINPLFIRDAEGLSRLAFEGNQTAISIYKSVGKYLGRAISFGLNLTNPSKVYLGGGVEKSLELFLPDLKKEIDRSCVPGVKNVEIIETKLGYYAALIGAAALVKLSLDDASLFLQGK